MIARAASQRPRLASAASSSVNQLARLSRQLFSSSPADGFNGGGGGGCSSVYSDARKYARPPTVTWQERLHNSASFIGTVEIGPKKIATSNCFGVYSVLSVKAAPDSHSSFRILLQMWNEMAERALQHLKPNDCIFVSGQLGAYTKASLEGVERIIYKVTARELNYVRQHEPKQHLQRVSKSEPSGESSAEKHRNRLLLWQVFFANPSEWYDQRKA